MTDYLTDFMAHLRAQDRSAHTIAAYRATSPHSSPGWRRNWASRCCPSR